jgi:hypothetical protein
MIAMLVVYYGNIWGAQSQPFMSTQLRTQAGGRYPTAKVFVDGILNQEALAKYGLPALSGTFTWSLFMANAAVSVQNKAFMDPFCVS